MTLYILMSKSGSITWQTPDMEVFSSHTKISGMPDILEKTTQSIRGYRISSLGSTDMPPPQASYVILHSHIFNMDTIKPFFAYLQSHFYISPSSHSIQRYLFLISNLTALVYSPQNTISLPSVCVVSIYLILNGCSFSSKPIFIQASKNTPTSLLPVL